MWFVLTLQFFNITTAGQPNNDNNVYFSLSGFKYMWYLSPALARWWSFDPVSLFVFLSRCLSGQFNYERLVPHKQYLQVHCWGCLVVQVMFHALMTSSMTSPGHKVCQILKLIYLRQYLGYVQRRSKAQNIGNGYLSGIFNFRYHFHWKSLSFKIAKY